MIIRANKRDDTHKNASAYWAYSPKESEAAAADGRLPFFQLKLTTGRPGLRSTLRQFQGDALHRVQLVIAIERFCWTVYGARSRASTHITEGTQWVTEVI